MAEKIFVKMEESKQKELFSLFIKRFSSNFEKASSYLEITRSHLSRLKRATSRYIPNGVLIKLVSYLNVEMPAFLFSGGLTKVRRSYMKEAHIALKKKYGENWAKELTNRRDFKGIHLNDFPDTIFIYLEDSYRKQLFNAAYNLFGSLEKLAKKIGISTSRLSFWFYGKQKDYIRNKEGLQFIPLSKLKLISRFLVEDSREEFSMENIEKHILMYRMQAGNPIKNPKFPIKESPEVVRLLFHLLGDGYSGGDGNSANYKNTCKELLDEFRNDLKLFGDVPIYEQEFSIKFPSVLAKIIEDFYEVNSRTYDSLISNKIFQIPKKNLYYGIRAFADDEGTIYPSSVRITSANYELLNGIKGILNFLKINSGSVKTQSNLKSKYGKTYYLDIKDIEKYHKHIGFTHPKKKHLLEVYVKHKKSKRRKKLLKAQ